MPETKKYLNRDGLEEYNSLLPHSSAEIQEYVDDWLDAHPEATTTVQDGSITTQKLADGSVTRNKLAADVAHLLGGMMVTGEVQGEILSANDAYSVAPLSMTVDGKSTQDGTPTPDAPVPINSIEVLELPVTFAGKNILDYNYFYDTTPAYAGDYWDTYAYPIALPPSTYTMSCNYGTAVGNAPYGFAVYGDVVSERTFACYNGRKVTITLREGERAILYRRKRSGNVPTRELHQNGTIKLQVELGPTATPYEPYVEVTAQIPMQGHVLRSLPDGTCDTLALTYLRPSTREGWAWYGAEVSKAVSSLALASKSWTRYSSTCFYTNAIPDRRTAKSGAYEVMSDVFAPAASNTLAYFNAHALANQIGLNQGSKYILVKTGVAYDSAADFKASLGDAYALYPLETPVTTQLDPIELPVLPAPTCTVWSDPSTGLKMSYMRDANIVISDIEQAIADL